MSDFSSSAIATLAPEADVSGGRELQPALDAVFPLLLAIADDDRAAPAISVTRELARIHGAIPTVLRALGNDREADVMLQSFAGYVVEGALSPEYRDETRNQLQRIVADAAGDVRWQFSVADESPVDAIVEHARQLSAGLIVMGLRRHGVMHRAIAGDLLRSVVRLAGVPVLAVEPDLVALPRRVVVGVDFGDASIRAAGIARHILAEGGEMHLVHVVTDSMRASNPVATIGGSGVLTHALRNLAVSSEDLQPDASMTIVLHVIEGEPEAAIDGFAERVRADLLAVGSDQHPLIDRLVSKSVSMGLARAARRSMLVVPAESCGAARNRPTTPVRFTQM
jgi:nucleotide-binding universal stress UspA family protein